MDYGRLRTDSGSTAAPIIMTSDQTQSHDTPSSRMPREASSQAYNVARKGLSLGIVCPMANEEKPAASLVEQVLAASSEFGDVRFYAVLDCVFPG
jgi:hypothetical protein